MSHTHAALAIEFALIGDHLLHVFALLMIVSSRNVHSRFEFRDNANVRRPQSGWLAGQLHHQLGAISNLSTTTTTMTPFEGGRTTRKTAKGMDERDDPSLLPAT